MPRQQRRRIRSGLALAAALGLALPAAAHLLVRGTPLAKLATTSPLVVVGTVESTGGGVTLAVERALIGSAPRGPLRFTAEGHHPPEYRTGQRVVVFLTRAEPPYVSRQTALDRIELPEDAEARAALFAAVQAYAGLRDVRDAAQHTARLEALALDHLTSPWEPLRREALLDLIALAGAGALDAAQVARIAALARRPDAPPTLGPGLVTLLAAVPRADAAAALLALVTEAPSAQLRALVAQTLGRRRDASAVPALTQALADPAPAVRESARRALETLGAVPAASQTTASNGRES